MSTYARKFSKTPQQATLSLFHKSLEELETARSDYQLAMRELETAVEDVQTKETNLQTALSRTRGASMAKLIKAEKTAKKMLCEARAAEESASRATQRLLQLLHLRTDMHETVKNGCGLIWSTARTALPRDTWLRMVAVNMVDGWELDVVARLDMVSRDMHAVCKATWAYFQRRGVLYTEKGNKDVLRLNWTGCKRGSMHVKVLGLEGGTKQALRYTRPVGWKEPLDYMRVGFCVEVDGWEKGTRLAMTGEMTRTYGVPGSALQCRVLRARRMGGRLVGMRGVVFEDRRYFREFEVDTVDYAIECDDAELTEAVVLQRTDMKVEFDFELQLRRLDGKLELVWVTYPFSEPRQSALLVGVRVDSEKPVLRVVRVS